MLLTLDNFLLNQIFLTGTSGATAVIFQSHLVIWAENLLRNQRATNQSLIQCGSRILKTGGLKSLFKGTFSLLCYNSFARFGDVASNFFILNFFKRHNSMQNTPLFIQSWFSWALATCCRVCIIPLEIYANPYNFRSIRSSNKSYVYLRAYLKQIKPQIMALYSWLLVQNYLIEYTDKVNYSDEFFTAWSKYVWIGFLSMASYDCYKKIKQWIFPKSLPHKFWFNRVFLRGINGSIFCSTSRLIKEKITQ